MKRIVNIKYVKRLVLLCAAVYFVSYLARINYAAVLVEMIQSEGLEKTDASFPLTALFITYGLGQLISGYLGDRFRPEKLIAAGLLLTAAMNVALPLSQSYLWMTAVWGVNGFAQALMWPPIVKIMTTYLSQEQYKKYIVYVIYGSYIGTMAVYFMVPSLIHIAGWKLVFFVAAAVALGMLFFWNQNIHKIESHAEDIETENRIETTQKMHIQEAPFTGIALALLACIMLTNIPQGILRDGVSSWMPTYITEVFHIESSISILTGVALPLFSVGITYISSLIHRKWIQNEGVCATLFFAICICLNLVLCTAGKQIPLLSVLCLLLMNAMANGINFIFTTLAIANFAPYGKTSFVSGAINSFVYVGSAISMYGIAYITENFGWDMTLYAWCGVGLLGLVTCIVSIALFQKIKRVNR